MFETVKGASSRDELFDNSRPKDLTWQLQCLDARNSLDHLGPTPTGHRSFSDDGPYPVGPGRNQTGFT